MTAASITGGGDFRIGDVMGRAWRLCTSNILFFLAVPFVIDVIAVVVALVFGLLFFLGGAGTGSYGLMGVGIFLAVILVFALYLIGFGVVLLGAFQRLRGQPLRVGEAVQRAVARIVPLAGLGILLGLAFGVTVGVCVAILSGIGSIVGGWVMVLSPVPWAILVTMWLVAAPACIVEGLGPIASMSRSAELSKGYRWKIFGILFLLSLVFLAGYVVQLIVTFASPTLGSIVGFVWSLAWSAYFYCSIIMMYHDLRVAKEGVDTEQIASVFD